MATGLERSGQVDIAVVGAGIAGLEVACGLARADADWVVLEAGPAEPLVHNHAVLSEDEALRRWLIPESDPFFVRPWRASSPPHFTGASGLRQRVGGRALYWYGVSIPMDDWALQSWPEEVRRELAGDAGGVGLFEEIMGELSSWTGRDLMDREPIGNFAGFALAAMPRAVRQLQDGRWDAYLPRPEFGPGNLRASSTVVSLTSGGPGSYRLELLSPKGDVTTIDASKVVLAAGAVVNAALLSSVDLAIGETAETPGITDSITQGFFAHFLPSSGARILTDLPTGQYFAPCLTIRSNLFIGVFERADGSVMVNVRCTGEQSAPGGMITTERTEAGALEISVSSKSAESDRMTIDGQRETLSRVWGAFCHSAGVQATPLEFGSFDAPDRTNEFVLPEYLATLDPAVPATWAGYLGTEDHEGTSTPIGPVLDNSLQSLAHPGIFVAGPSVFPRLGAANPVVTALALSRRLARSLVTSD